MEKLCSKHQYHPSPKTFPHVVVGDHKVAKHVDISFWKRGAQNKKYCLNSMLRKQDATSKLICYHLGKRGAQTKEYCSNTLLRTVSKIPPQNQLP